ncbi:general secretory pathway component, cryptic [Escherichia coli]|uniref:General secretory pathway component, cryptic n=1 Tax=Escherichia coli TaxID=562 RepID=A0A2X1JHQ0_ECOLX|nr:general secretory pathway component, cryptic [Escherichia coli]
MIFSKEQVSKVPLLGDIPLVGQLFRYTSTERAKRNLMVFIRDDDVYRSLVKREIHPLPSGATTADRREIKSAGWLGRFAGAG